MDATRLTDTKMRPIRDIRERKRYLLRKQRIDGIRGLGWTLLGWGVHVYAVLHATGVFLVCAWRHWAGRIPKR